MSERTNRWSDQQIERLVGRLLQIGVLASAAVVVAGGAIYLAQRGGTLAGHHVFRGEPERLRRPSRPSPWRPSIFTPGA